MKNHWLALKRTLIKHRKNLEDSNGQPPLENSERYGRWLQIIDTLRWMEEIEK